MSEAGLELPRLQMRVKAMKNCGICGKRLPRLSISGSLVGENTCQVCRGLGVQTLSISVDKKEGHSIIKHLYSQCIYDNYYIN